MRINMDRLQRRVSQTSGPFICNRRGTSCNVPGGLLPERKGDIDYGM